MGFFSISALSLALYITSFGLGLGSIFTRKLMTIAFSPESALYSALKNSSSQVVTSTLDISLQSTCLNLKNSSTGHNCYTRFTNKVLQDFNITLYDSTTGSVGANNYLDVPAMAQQFSTKYLWHLRNLLICILILIFFLLCVEASNVLQAHFKPLVKLRDFVLKKKSESSTLRYFSLIVLILVNVLNVFVTIYLTLSLYSTSTIITQSSFRILKCDVSKRFDALFWSNFAVLLFALGIKLAALQMKYIQGRNAVKIDIIQPKV